MAPSPLQLMRKNLKTSIFAITVSSGSLWYAYDNSLTNDVMRYSCRRATMLGEKKLNNPHAHPRHITVILNPVAGKRKSKKLYNKWVEPLLHLAGIKVSVIETESPNQAYDLMKIMSNCDGVAVVGGDGTVHEALNGLLHRPDASKAVQEFPIGIMPTGQFNSIARYIHQNISYRNQKEFLIQSTLRLIDQCIEKHDVLKITPVKQKDDTDLPVYALRDVRYGKYQDNFVKLTGFTIYQLYFKPYWMRLQRIFGGSKYPKPEIDSLSYTKPCIGCSRCFEKHRLLDTNSTISKEASTNRRWWSMLAPVAKSTNKTSDEDGKELELAQRDNPFCDKWTKVANPERVTDFRACMMGDKKVRLSLSSNGEFTASEIIETQDVKLRLSSELDERYKEESEKKKGSELQVTDQNIELSNSTEVELEKKSKDEVESVVKFLIDGQPSQAHSIEVTSIHKAVNIFTGPLKVTY